MNISFGNLVEIIMFFAALKHNQIRVVKSALVGSMLVNLLLTLGCSIITAELKTADLVLDMNNAQALACLLSLSIFSILIPMAFHFTLHEKMQRNYTVQTLSRASALILLLVYLVYLVFLLKPPRKVPTPARMEEGSALNDGVNHGMEERVDDPYIGSPLNVALDFDLNADQHRPRQKSDPVTPDCSRAIRPVDKRTQCAESSTYISHVTFNHSNNETLSRHGEEENGRKLTHPTLGRSRSRSVYSNHSRSFSQGSFANTRLLRASDIVERYADRGGHVFPLHSHRAVQQPQPVASPFHIVEPNNEVVEESSRPRINRAAGIVVLAASTLVTAICAEYLVATIEPVMKTSGLTESFIGLIILSVIGNAAEFITGVRVAARGKLDLAIGVSFGLSIHIALFVIPLTVIGGWLMGRDMTLVPWTF
ncbi:hypothetical protein F5Y16DRAFT_377976 [Xylariaceae sp. FL0255]|nr:hypothetical protein F5Y16DRAFT_377976 [Xylariaceae sp. FL0255]